ncbi:MAG: DUF1761 domain-containing protein [Pseudomonadota bacterium]
MPEINLLAVAAAALSAFLLGGLWYGPLFGRRWLAACGVSEDALSGRSMGRVFGLAAVLSLIAAANLAAFLGPEADLTFGLFAGFAAGFGWVAAFLGIIYLFEARPLSLWLINGGYATVALTIMGAILGAMR